MGCEAYNAEGARIHFSESNDDVGCLCTFPFNDMIDDGVLCRSRLKSLALLGLAVVLLRRGDIKASDEPFDWVFIPGNLPEHWVQKILALDYVIDDD